MIVVMVLKMYFSYNTKQSSITVDHCFIIID